MPTYKRMENLAFKSKYNDSNKGLQKHVNIITRLSLTQFPNLITFTITQTDIDSVEMLNRIWMPHLRTISFLSNRITSI